VKRAIVVTSGGSRDETQNDGTVISGVIKCPGWADLEAAVWLENGDADGVDVLDVLESGGLDKAEWDVGHRHARLLFRYLSPRGQPGTLKAVDLAPSALCKEGDS